MRILLVEDEPQLRERLRAQLQRAGYAVDAVADGRSAWFQGDVEPYDLVVLDWGLPEVDGLTVLRRWRAAGMQAPVLMLTARDTWQEKVDAIDAGADDYLSKPFQVEELLARLRALIRRAHGKAASVLRVGGLALDVPRQIASLDGVPLELTTHEWRVLAYLAHRAGEVVSRSELSDHIYGSDAQRDSNTIEVFIARLRRKLPSGMIETVRGAGYRLLANESDAAH